MLTARKNSAGVLVVLSMHMSAHGLTVIRKG